MRVSAIYSDAVARFDLRGDLTPLGAGNYAPARLRNAMSSSTGRL